MSRLEINLPEKYLFSTEIPIRIGDINRASHLSHVHLVQIIEEARARFVSSLGYGDEVKFNHDSGFILGDLGVIFKGQAFYGQSLKVEIGIVDIQEKCFDMVYRVTDSEKGALVATGKTTILAFDYLRQKVVPLPPDLREKAGVK